MSFLGELIDQILGREKNLEELYAVLRKAQGEGDYLEVTRLYFKIGKKYMEQGNEEKAMLYISRFDTMVGSDDSILKKISSQKVGQAVQWIGMLENRRLFANEVHNLTEEKGLSLDITQKIQWNLLTLARFNILMKRLSELYGFEVLKDFEEVIHMLTQGQYRSLGEEELDFLRQFILDFYPFTDSKALADTANQIEISDGAALEAYDLTGNSALVNMYLLLDELIQMAEGEEKDVTVDFVPNALLTDYYVRTREEDLNSITALKEEKDRICSDYEFVMEHPEQKEFMTRMEKYMKLSLPA